MAKFHVRRLCGLILLGAAASVSYATTPMLEAAHKQLAAGHHAAAMASYREHLIQVDADAEAALAQIVLEGLHGSYERSQTAFSVLQQDLSAPAGAIPTHLTQATDQFLDALQRRFGQGDFGALVMYRQLAVWGSQPTQRSYAAQQLVHSLSPAQANSLRTAERVLGVTDLPDQRISANQACAAFGGGDWQRAALLYQQQAQQQPRNAEPHLAGILVAVEQQDQKRADEQYAQYSELLRSGARPGKPAKILNCPALSLSSERYQQTLLQKFVDGQAYQLQPLLDVAAASGQFDLRQQQVLALLGQLDVESPQHIAYTEGLVAGGRIEQALRYLDHQIRRNPRVLKLRERWATYQSWLGEYDIAEQEYRGILQVDPNYSQAMMGVGNIRLWTQQREEALLWYQHAFARDPKNNYAWRKIEVLQGRLPRAVQSALVELSEPEVYREIGELHAVAQQFHEAANWYSDYLILRPYNRLARREYASALAEIGQLQEASREYDELLVDAPNDRALRVRQAKLQAWGQQPETAIESLQNLLNENPQDLETALVLANVYRWTDRYDDARVLYQQILARQPGNTGAQQGLAQLPAEPVPEDQLAQAEPEPQEPPPPTARERLERLFFDGAYWRASRLGEEVIAANANDTEARMWLAKSLAWTAQYKRAVRQLEILRTVRSSVAEATQLLADVQRWQNRPLLSAPHYRAVQRNNPNDRAIDGHNRVARELRPKTTLQFGHEDDSTDFRRPSLRLTHRWRGWQNPEHLFEVEAFGNALRRDNARLDQVGYGIAYEHTGLELSPRVELSVQTDPDTDVFGNVRLRLHPNLVNLRLGRVNWGELAFDQQALSDGLTAIHGGLDGKFEIWAGRFSFDYDGYAISDDNAVHNANIKLRPRWPGFGENFHYFFGASGRIADDNAPRYWSPTDGHATFDVGFVAEWTGPFVDAYLSAQRGFRIAGEADNTYSIGAGLKAYLDADWTFFINGNILRTPRDGGYRYSGVFVGLERLW